MAVYISVISHGHASLIEQLSCIDSLSKTFHVVIKSNTKNDKFDQLLSCANFHWLNNQFGCGFGHNNNIVYDYCVSELGMTSEDYFIVLNPDVIIETNEILKLIENMRGNNIKLSTINLYRDENMTVFDNSVRTFPSFKQFFLSFIGVGNSSLIDKRKIEEPTLVDWAAGSFLAFKSSHYLNLSGFDENYFMYCEDIDICFRSAKLDEKVTYYPKLKAVHLAKFANRSILSKHFYWHVTSVIRFLIRKSINLSVKSNLSR